MKFTSGLDIINYCNETKQKLHEVSLSSEIEKTGRSYGYIRDYLKNVLRVMEAAVKAGINDVDNHIKGKIIGNDSVLLKKRIDH